MEHRLMGMGDDPLALDATQMRRMGYAVVDLLVDRAVALADAPAIRTASPEALRELMTDNEAVDQAIRRTAQQRLMVR